MDLTKFGEYFAQRHAALQTGFTLSVQDFAQTMVDYVEAKLAEKAGNSKTPAKFIYTEGAEASLMRQKLEANEAAIHKIFRGVYPLSETEVPLGRVKEIWLQISLLIRSVLVKAGTPYVLGEPLSNQSECLDALHQFVCSAHQESICIKPEGDSKGIIRKDGAQWPREAVQAQRDAAANGLVRYTDEATLSALDGTCVSY